MHHISAEYRFQKGLRMMNSLPIDSMSDAAKKQNFTTLYEKIMQEGLAGFHSEAAFNDACRFTVKLCLSVADYLHANNVMQAYKQSIERNRAAWVYIDSILLYGRRLPRTYLRKPEMLKKTLERLDKDGDPYIINQALVTLVKFYVDLYKNYGKKFQSDLLNFTSYFKENAITTYPAFLEGVNALSNYCDGLIGYEDIAFDLNIAPPITKKPVASHSDVTAKESAQVVYSPNPKILILGAMRIKKDVAKGIAKQFDFTSDQLEFVDYDDVKGYPIQKLQYNNHYCGIVLGPIPHSATGTNGESSIITHIENTEGYPLHVRATANEALKITKTSLLEALRTIKHHYENTKLD